MGISFNERKEEKGMKERVDKGKANSIALDIRKPLAEVPHSVGNIKGNINREVKNMNETKINQHTLFGDMKTDVNGLVIKDTDEKEKYSVEELKNKVILGDAFKVLKKIDDEVFDMVFIDPPYFLQLPNKELRRWTVKTVVEGVNDEWDKFSSFQEYDDFITKLLTEVKRVMKPNATIWVISTYHSIFRIGKIMQDLGYWILNDVIWVKTNPMPNWLGVRFTNATENLIWAVKDKKAKKYTFNKEYARKFGIGKVGANVWVLPLCWGKERLKNEEGKKLHSTQKPVELLKRVILTSTKEGDLILDPWLELKGDKYGH